MDIEHLMYHPIASILYMTYEPRFPTHLTNISPVDQSEPRGHNMWIEFSVRQKPGMNPRVTKVNSKQTKSATQQKCTTDITMLVNRLWSYVGHNTKYPYHYAPKPTTPKPLHRKTQSTKEKYISYRIFVFIRCIDNLVLRIAYNNKIYKTYYKWAR